MSKVKISFLILRGNSIGLKKNEASKNIANYLFDCSKYIYLIYTPSFSLLWGKWAPSIRSLTHASNWAISFLEQRTCSFNFFIGTNAKIFWNLLFSYVLFKYMNIYKIQVCMFKFILSYLGNKDIVLNTQNYDHFYLHMNEKR